MGWTRALFRRRRLEQDLDDELTAHIEQLAGEYEASGLSAEEALLAAKRRFGNVPSVQERCRERNGVARVETVFQDARFALRTFAAQPGFVAVVLTTLALGIGANTAVFSVLRAVLLEPLPLPEPERIVFVWEHDRLRKTEREAASYPDYVDLRAQASQFEYLGASQGMNVTLTGTGEAERVPAARVSSAYFGVLGLQPVIGRVFGPGEDGVVLSYSLWQRKFGGSHAVLGQALSIDGFSGTVVGVLPAEANSLMPRSAELWSSLENVTATQFRGQHSTRVLGRLRRGATVEQAQAEVAAIMARLEKEHPNDNLGRGATVVPLREELAGNMRPALKVLAAAVVVLLLIACVNIANLLLARAATRTREIAIRSSLGAGRGRLTRQLLTESLLLAFAGGALGIVVAWCGVRVLVAVAPADIPLIGRAGIDTPALIATMCVSLAAWLIFRSGAGDARIGTAGRRGASSIGPQYFVTLFEPTTERARSGAGGAGCSARGLVGAADQELLAAAAGIARL
jgi:predicted permease